MSDPIPHTPRKRAQIIEAAVTEFQEKGFVAASMDTISTRACVSKRTLYKYFESKEKLFVSIIAELSDRISHSLNITYKPGYDIRAQLTALALAEGQLLTSPNVMAMSRMLIGETLRNPSMAGQVQGKIDKKSAFVGMLRDATNDGKLNVPDAESAAEEFIALIKAKAFWPVIFGAPIVTDAQMEMIVADSVEMMMCRYSDTT